MHPLLTYIKPTSEEIAQRWAKIFINSCYDKIVTSAEFELYEIKNEQG